MSGSSVRTWWQWSRPWLAPWARSSIAGMVVFGVFHQFLVEPTLFVFVGIPMAMALSILIVAAFIAALIAQAGKRWAKMEKQEEAS